MVKIAYAHDGVNVYDDFFLRHLGKKNNVFLLTFNVAPDAVPSNARVLRMKEPLANATADVPSMEGFRMYALCFLRAILMRLYLDILKPRMVMGCMATKYGFYAAMSGFRPFLLIVWGSDVLIAPRRSFLLRFIAKYTLRKADAVIVDSEVQRKAVIELGCNPNKVLKFPWFDLTCIEPNTDKRSQIRRRLGWVDNPIVVCIRMHEPIYGVEYFIEAIPEVINAVPESRFLLIGEGRLSTQLRKRVQELGVGLYVKFMGRLTREETIACMGAADIYVSASLSDGTSASLLEAMALGLPPVVTEIPGNKEWIRDGWNGFLVPVKNPRLLANGIISLLKEKALRDKVGKRAHETARTKVDWSKNSRALDSLIHGLIVEHQYDLSGRSQTEV